MEEFGQSTVEYALVSAAFIAVVAGLGALANVLQDGLLVSHIVSAASHGLEGVVGGMTDVFCY